MFNFKSLFKSNVNNPIFSKHTLSLVSSNHPLELPSTNPKMAPFFKASHPIFLCFILLCCFHFSLINCSEFEVGGHDGWVVPKSKDNEDIYNQWASENRFKVNDTVRFKYEKDSVLVVTEEEYERCKSSRPLFFSNNGDTVFKFDRPGTFFFISGVSGHCTRGQKLIIKVLNVEEPAAQSPQSADVTAQTPSSKSGVAEMSPLSFTTGTVFVVSLFGLVYA